MANHSHRSGRLKQSNKKNKRANASKRSKNRLAGGKIQSLPSSSAGPGGSGGGGIGRKGLKSNDKGGKDKFKRMNAAKQRREVNRKNVWNARRGVGALSADGDVTGVAATLSRALANAPPRIVGIVSLSELEGPLEERVRTALKGGADKALTSASGSDLSTVTTSYSMHAKGGQPHITILTNTTSFRPQYSTKYGEEDASVQGALDLCRVCDLVLFLIDGSTVISSHPTSQGGSGSVGGSIGGSIKTSNTTAHLDHLVSERGDRILAAIKAQGLPTPVTVIVHKDGSDNETDSPLGQHVGADGDDDDVMEEEDEYEEEMMDGLASMPGHSLATNRSMKSIRRSYMRRRTELKRYVTRFAATEFGEGGSKVVEVDIINNDNADDSVVANDMEEESVATSSATVATSAASKPSSQTSVAAMIRMLCTISASGPHWVADASRPYLVTDGCITNTNSGSKINVPPVQYNASTQELQLTGYIRGNTPWNCNQLVHVPHLGTFAVKNVKLAGVNVSEDSKEMLPPIVAAGRKVRKWKGEKNVDMEGAASNENKDAEGLLLAEADPEERESLEMFASPDALEGEQNLIGFDDDEKGVHFDDNLDDIQEETKADTFQPGTSRPAGWSDYQSAWLDALDPNDEEAADRGELAFALNKKDTDTVMNAEDDEGDVNAEEKRQLLAQRKKNAQSDLQFPDEVDHEEETSARDRYPRYRAIKSFRKSYWDPKENLPESYGAVYHFASFKATQRDVLEDVKEVGEVVNRRGWGLNVADQGRDVEGKKGADVDMDSEDEEEEDMVKACVPPGAYVTITLEGVPSSAYANLSQSTLLTAVSLLPHENKVSVLHMGLCTSAKSADNYDTEIPIKSKDALTFRCGWRTWQSRPVFSQHNLNSDKHKFERYLPTGTSGHTYFAGSVFGPVTYAPCPVMMFREANEGGVGDEGMGGGKREFLAHGSMLGADADRIVLKRIVLTGFPTRVHKRHATVKYMFYNPEDVKWFMPAGITTKHGLQGNIIQSVGDHGVMKCLFNAPIKQHDTVCLPLYKRVFPKFVPVAENKDGQEEDVEGATIGGGEGGLGSMSKHFRVL